MLVSFYAGGLLCAARVVHSSNRPSFTQSVPMPTPEILYEYHWDGTLFTLTSRNPHFGYILNNHSKCQTKTLWDMEYNSENKKYPVPVRSTVNQYELLRHIQSHMYTESKVTHESTYNLCRRMALLPPGELDGIFPRHEIENVRSMRFDNMSDVKNLLAKVKLAEMSYFHNNPFRERVVIKDMDFSENSVFHGFYVGEAVVPIKVTFGMKAGVHKIENGPNAGKKYNGVEKIKLNAGIVNLTFAPRSDQDVSMQIYVQLVAEKKLISWWKFLILTIGMASLWGIFVVVVLRYHNRIKEDV